VIHLDAARVNKTSKNYVFPVVITCLQADAIGEAHLALQRFIVQCGRKVDVHLGYGT
jgi:hypothetical protein